MNSELKNAIEEAVPGLKIDGQPTIEDALAIGSKVIEATALVAATAKPDSKVDRADVTIAVNALASLAPTSFKKAVLDHFENEIKDTKNKIDDAIGLPVIAIFRRILGVK
jgi:hypothetical protein